MKRHVIHTVFLLRMAALITAVPVYSRNAGKPPPALIHYPELANSVDRAVNPCDDFHSFVCNGWKSKHPLTEDKASHNSYSILDDIVEEQIKEILRAEENENHEDKLMHTLFRKCLEDQHEPSDSDAAAMVFDRVRRVRDVNGDDILTDWMLIMQPTDAFFDVYVAPDERNSTLNIIHISPGSPYLSQSEHVDRVNMWYEYQKLNVLLANLERFDRSHEFSRLRDIRNIPAFLRLDYNLAEIIEKAEPNSYSTKTFSLNELQGSVRAINWRRYFGAVIPPDVGIDIDNIMIQINNHEALQLIDEALSTANTDDIRNYLNLKTVTQYWENDEIIPIAKEHEDICVDVVMRDFNDLLIAKYVERHFDHNSVPLVKNMVEEIRKSFVELLEQNDWMDSEAKQRAIRKTNAIRDSIADFGEEFSQIDIKKKYSKLNFDSNQSYYQIHDRIALWERWIMFEGLGKANDNNSVGDRHDQLEANAIYSYKKNQIEILAGILRPPFFNSSLPRLINYAAIGSTIGHEITHAFDETGAKYDEYGKRKNWWDETSKRNFEERKSCIEKQYGSLSLRGRRINGKRTKSENIADNGGIRASLKAVSKFIDSRESNFVVDRLQEYSPMQIFFMNFAMQECSNTSPEIDAYQIAVGTHSPNAFRVNTVLGNQPEFAEAFQCPLGSKMNPESKCRVW